MAKINHNNHLNTIDSLFTDAKKRGVLHLQSSAGLVSGRNILIGEQQHINFGSLGYLALETDDRLKEGAIDFVRRFGTQSVMSRTYINTSIMEALEAAITQMFDAKALVYSRASTAHISLIPTLVDRNDAIVLDQQCHFSIQTASQLQRQKGVTIEMIKHNNLDMLEAKLKELRNTHQKIWYMADGVYSMFGDVAPMAELLALADKYPQLWLYVDDAHGMSWCGTHGNGYVLKEGELYHKLVLVSTMAKGFGAHGGIAVFPNDELYRMVKVFGGPLSYSLPLSPADIGACLASAKIHLSPEIYDMQKELLERIAFCNELLDATDLPVISNPETPIYFIGMGQPKVGYNMVSRLLNEGIYLNPSFFPMVPAKATGLRFGLTRNHTKGDIKKLVGAIEYHFPKALEEEGRTSDQVRRAFRLPLKKNTVLPLRKVEDGLRVQYKRSIAELNAREWDEMMASFGTVDAAGMAFMEEAFSGNEKAEENWGFHYFIIRDQKGVPVVATFFTEGIFKDDFLADASVSRQIEVKREKDPYYLSTRALFSGSMISEGSHLYVRRTHPKWQDALQRLLDETGELQERLGIKKLMFSDFLASDTALAQIFMRSGFFKIDMPYCNVIEDLNWENEDAFLNKLGRTHRKNVKKEAVAFKHCYKVEVKQHLSREECAHFYELFLNVKRRNQGLNFYDYPENILEVMSKHPNWEFIVLSLQPAYDDREVSKPVAALWCYKGAEHYSPMIIGMDYSFNETYKLYKQALYQTVMRARALDMQKVYLGFSADTEKKKYGAVQIAKVAFAQAKDNFNLEVIESMGVAKASG